MPYKLKKYKTGFKVCKADDMKRCFSKKPLPKLRAIKQMKAIGISESKMGKGATQAKLETTTLRDKNEEDILIRAEKIINEIRKINDKQKIEDIKDFIEHTYNVIESKRIIKPKPKDKMKKWTNNEWEDFYDWIRIRNLIINNDETYSGNRLNDFINLIKYYNDKNNWKFEKNKNKVCDILHFINKYQLYGYGIKDKIKVDSLFDLITNDNLLNYLNLRCKNNKEIEDSKMFNYFYQVMGEPKKYDKDAKIYYESTFEYDDEGNELNQEKIIPKKIYINSKI